MSQFLRVLLFIVIVCCIFSLALGKDLTWDFYNYHLYAPHAALNYELHSDFMGSGWVRYLNPYASVPFYLMATAGWPDTIISMLLAAVHSLNIVLVWWICREHLFGHSAASRDWVALATYLACVTTVFLGMIGSTFTDPLTSTFILGALAALLQGAASTTPRRYIVTSGLLAGIAVGLKLTNIVGCLALAVAILAFAQSWGTRLKVMLIFGFSSGAGFMIANGWWAWQLYAEFGNPVFPLMNTFFQSADFPQEALRSERFLPLKISDWLLLPLRMLEHRSWVYYEVTAPDWRFAFLLVLLVAFLAKKALGRHALHEPPKATGQPTTFVFFAFLGASYFFWQATSGNARYALPIILLVGPACVWLAIRVLPTPSIAKSTLLVLATVQTFVVTEAGNPRWSATDWSGKWIDYVVPQALKQEGFGYLSLGTNSLGTLAPFVHKDARFINLTGLHVTDPHGPGGKRVREFLARHEGRLRMLGVLSKDQVKRWAQTPEPIMRTFNAQLAPWGLSMTDSGCEFISEVSGPADPTNLPTGAMLSCSVLQSSAYYTQQEADRLQFDNAFNFAEKHCPHLFRPKGVYSVMQSTMWTRRYFDTDILLFSSKGRVAYSRYDYGPWDIDIGSLAELADGRGTPSCSSR